MPSRPAPLRQAAARAPRAIRPRRGAGRSGRRGRRRPAAPRRGRDRDGCARRAGRPPRPGLLRRAARPRGAAGVDDRDPQASLAQPRVDDDRRAAVLDRVDDQVVERLGERAAIAADDRAARRSSAAPASRPRASPAPASGRPPTATSGLPSTAPRPARSGPPLISRSSRSSAAAASSIGSSPPADAAEPRADGQGDRLQRPAQLVQRLVEGAAPPAGAQALSGDRRRHREGERPAGDDLSQLDHPSTSRYPTPQQLTT